MIMSNRDFYAFINELAKNENFNQSVAITDRKEDEQFRLELILRLLIASSVDIEALPGYPDLKELLDRETIRLMETTKFEEFSNLENKFNRTFKLLNDLLGDGAFKKFIDDRPKGAFLVAAFQGIATGIFCNLDFIESLSNEVILEKIKNFYEEKIYIKFTEKGARSVPRFKELTILGKEYFSHEN